MGEGALVKIILRRLYNWKPNKWCSITFKARSHTPDGGVLGICQETQHLYSFKPEHLKIVTEVVK
tara:strand:- start:42 stop:236 length:195 start_codon:yes stop_codon:yes gene_type:complete